MITISKRSPGKGYLKISVKEFCEFYRNHKDWDTNKYICFAFEDMLRNYRLWDNDEFFGDCMKEIFGMETRGTFGYSSDEVKDMTDDEASEIRNFARDIFIDFMELFCQDEFMWTNKG